LSNPQKRVHEHLLSYVLCFLGIANRVTDQTVDITAAQRHQLANGFGVTVLC